MDAGMMVGVGAVVVVVGVVVFEIMRSKGEAAVVAKAIVKAKKDAGKKAEEEYVKAVGEKMGIEDKIKDFKGKVEEKVKGMKGEEEKK